MKIAVYDDHRVGLVEGDQVYDVTAALPGADAGWPPVQVNRMIAQWDAVRPRIEQARASATPVPLAGVMLGPPVPWPSHVLAAPANYRKHIGELGERTVTQGGRSAREQGVFLKAPGSLVGAGGEIRLPKDSARRFDHECELAVIIGRTARNVPRAQALQHVFGYACLIDVTMRIEPGVPGEERSMRKSFETFTPLGPWLVTADEVPDPQALDARLWVNGELRQQANTRDMIVGVAELVELASSVLTLRPGDVIASGTPEGVGPLAPGDQVKIAIDGVGEMTLPVRASTHAAPRTW